MELLRTVAYHLQLPENAHIHDVFHVDVLKPFIGTPPPWPLLRRYLRCSMGALFSSQSTSSVLVCVAAPGTFWCSGLVHRRRKQPRNLSTHSVQPIPRFSSRTSCFQRGKRCYGGPAVPPSGTHQWLGDDHQGSMPSPRARSPQLWEPVLIGRVSFIYSCELLDG